MRCVVVQSLSRVWLCDPRLFAALRAPLSSTVSRVCWSSYPLSRWCHPIISFSVSPFFSFSQSFSASGSFPLSWLFSSGSQRIVASASVLPMNIQGLFPFRIGWFDLLAVQGTLRSLLQHHTLKESVLQLSAFFVVQLSHLYMTTGKTIALTTWAFVGKVMSLL